ncbi:MAG TPA: 50S ribosomal protein L4 [Acidimicrobiales bacterium]|nr:50S ribosomal protein L4 [Acidimicrobiales bacterium]
MSAVEAPARQPSIMRRERPAPERRTVDRRRLDGTVIEQVVLAPEIFGIVPNTAVLHQVVTAQLASARAGTQSTKTRAEVAGGGAKPFRQKGTGRARQGSTRSPQWVGGGIALGPKPRSYRQRTPKKMIRLALYSALSDRAAEGRIALIDEWSFAVPKTRDAVAALGALELQGRVLVVLGPEDGIADRSLANLQNVQTLQVAELNAYDILRSDWVVFTDATLPGETETATTPAAAKPARKAPAAEKATSAIDESTVTAADADTTDADTTDADTAAEGEGSDA